MGHKKSPPSGETLVGALQNPSEDSSKDRNVVAKYARLKRINGQIGAILGAQIGDKGLQEKLESCGRYIAFRKYLESGNFKLTTGNFCNAHMLCPPCAAARSRRLLGRWLPVIFGHKNSKTVRHYLLTLTWPPPAFPQVAGGPRADVYKLRANLAVGVSAWGKLWKRRVNRGTGPLVDVLGAILATEVTQGPAGWHPHFHILCTMPRNCRISALDLREEWKKLTGGVFVNLKVLMQETDVVEVFKYAVKPADLDKGGNVLASGVEIRHKVYQALKGARLIRGFGGYFNVQDVDLQEEETFEEIGDWVDLVFKWSGMDYKLISSGTDKDKPRGKHAKL